jgi:hypothetical protein
MQQKGSQYCVVTLPSSDFYSPKKNLRTELFSSSFLQVSGVKRISEKKISSQKALYFFLLKGIESRHLMNTWVLVTSAKSN